MPKTPREQLMKAASEQKMKNRFGFFERLFHGRKGSPGPARDKTGNLSPQPE